jgi:5-methylcytosine-specific restriction endonuclease McrA
MPNGVTVTGRISSIRNVFVAAIVPIVKPSVDEVKQVLSILNMTPSTMTCSYCGGTYTEWDHLMPLVIGGRPTGYPSSIRNLVPSCGRCNQSKGKSDWKLWMFSNARWSPTSRAVVDLEQRAKRIENYQAWAKCEPLDIVAAVPPDLLAKYYDVQSEILTSLKTAQDIALEISAFVRKAAKDKS